MKKIINFLNSKKLFFKILAIAIAIFSFIFIIPLIISYRQTQATTWYDYAWGYKQAITIDHTKVSAADQVNFPVLIHITDAGNQIFTAKSQSDGDDILFANFDNTQKLSHEITKFDKDAKVFTAWVKVPTLSHTEDTIINMYYGNSSCPSQQDVENTWNTNYKGVWHMDYNWDDSTAGNSDGTAYNGAVFTSGGKIGDAGSFSNDGNDYVDVGAATSYAGGPASVETWMYSRGPALYDKIFSKVGGFYVDYSTSGPRWRFMCYKTDDTLVYAGGNNSVVNNQWNHFVVTWDGTTSSGFNFYLNGSLLGKTTFSNSAGAYSEFGNMYIANDNPATVGFYGELDEMRISNTARDANWVATSFNNQNSPSTFYQVGVEVEGDIVPPVNPNVFAGYNTAGKTATLTSEHWYNYANPYFEWSGATDDTSGVKGYYAYFGTTSDADPHTAGTYQVHVGALEATQNYTSSSNLGSGETYYFRIITEDRAGNRSDAETKFIYKFENSLPDPPGYVNVSPVGCTTQTTFTFSWPAVIDVDDSGLAGYQYKRGSTGTIENTTELSLETTAYQEGDNVFYVRSYDNAGNHSSWQTSIYCSTVVANLVDGPTVDPGPSSITVNWSSNKVTTGYVKVYEGNTYVSEQGHTSYSTDHSVRVVGLEPEKNYRYKLTWVDSFGNLGESDWFQTTTTTAPSIKNFTANIISTYSVVVSWETTTQASASYSYGQDNYDSTVNIPGTGTSFSRELSDLKGGTTYQIRITARTNEDDIGYPFYYTTSFTTPPLPSIVGMSFESSTENASPSLKVSWSTNVNTTSSLFYREQGQGSFKEIADSNKAEDHKLIINDLADSTIYELYAQGIDEYGNIAKSDTNTVTTPLDTRPPKISDITIETSNVGIGREDESQIVVSWKTDESATSKVQYAEGISGKEYTNSTNEDPTQSNSHLVIVSGLKESIPYHLRVCSTDKGKNTTCSDDNTVIPGEVQKSIFTIILNTFKQAFGWVGGLIK